ncbi:MAG: hypothetical protein U1E65_33060 [Myxococcota bacterium]
MRNPRIYLAALAGLSAALLVVTARPALARTVDDCALAWGQAARSYLTQNRTKGPEDQVFRSACQLESNDKDKARVEAILAGTKSLVKVDKAGCRRFLESYVQAQESDKICDAAAGNDDASTRKLIVDNIPPRKSKK